MNDLHDFNSGCIDVVDADDRSSSLAGRGFDQRRAEAAVRELLIAVGEDPDRDGLIDTPRRVARMYRELFAGMHDDAEHHLSRVFDERGGESILLRDIPFASICEHHLLPFTGTAHVAYLPGRNIVGLSKLARTVDVFARRPQVQERLTGQIVDAIMLHLDARGAFVMIEAEHSCMKLRGVQKSGSRMITTAARGEYQSNPALRNELLALLRRGE